MNGKFLFAFAAVFLISALLALQAQHNALDLSIGYPNQFTKHWLVSQWNNPFNIKAIYSKEYNKGLFGVGVNYSSYKISWTEYYKSNRNSLNDISPFVSAGLSLKKNKLKIVPRLNVGYSFILTNIEIYSSNNKGGFYLSPDISVRYQVTQKLDIGFISSYNMIFQKLQLDPHLILPANIIMYSEETIRYITYGLNASLRF